MQSTLQQYRKTAEEHATRMDNVEVDVRFDNLELFASGAFSNVYRGNLNDLNRTPIVVKKTWARPDKVLPELDILKVLYRIHQHKNIIPLLYYFKRQHDSMTCHSLVFEFIPLNLYQFMKKRNRVVGIADTKMIIWQLFRGLDHLMRANICHRDIKPQNLLVNEETGLLKIGDFGSSCVNPIQSPQPTYHVTRYYRPPELILGVKRYGCEIDVWSCGCVFGEMLRCGVLFVGKTSEHQFQVIADIIGMPTPAEIQAMGTTAAQVQQIYAASGLARSRRTMRELVCRQTQEVIDADEQFHLIDLLRNILCYTPRERYCGLQVLDHPFFHDLFDGTARRSDGRRIRCLQFEDLQRVRSGDDTMTGTTVSVSREVSSSNPPASDERSRVVRAVEQTTTTAEKTTAVAKKKRSTESRIKPAVKAKSSAKSK